MDDVAGRLATRVQLTTDGYKPYLQAVEGAFGAAVDYTQLLKLYGDAPGPAGRYSPAACVGAQNDRIEGNPDPAHVSTSYAERQNLTMRMGDAPLHAPDERLPPSMLKVTRTYWCCSMCITISSGCTKRRAARPRWRPASPRLSGPWTTRPDPDRRTGRAGQAPAGI